MRQPATAKIKWINWALSLGTDHTQLIYCIFTVVCCCANWELGLAGVVLKWGNNDQNAWDEKIGLHRHAATAPHRTAPIGPLHILPLSHFRLSCLDTENCNNDGVQRV